VQSPSALSPVAHPPQEPTTLPERPAPTAQPAEQPQVPEESKAAREKREKKEKKQMEKKQKEKQPKPPKAPAPPKPKNEPPTPNDPQQMFKVGFLQDVYNERPLDSVVTRFPPEPSGHLHLGHSKAIAVNFGFARYHGGICYLRYDDTNPSAEKKEYFESIKDIVAWLGFKPVAITHSSDYFDRLYELAEELIRKDGEHLQRRSDSG
jgi:glutaminyl-tRNA synthetase